MYDIEINIPALCAEAIDEAIINDRSRSDESGQPIAAAHAPDTTLEDYFTRILAGIASDVLTAIKPRVAAYRTNTVSIRYGIGRWDGIPPDTAATLVKDALKAGLLTYWYAAQDAQLYPVYAARYAASLDNLKYKAAGFVAERPYRML